MVRTRTIDGTFCQMNGRALISRTGGVEELGKVGGGVVMQVKSVVGVKLHRDMFLGSHDGRDARAKINFCRMACLS